MPRLARKPTCHPERKHSAKGLCDYCYKAQWWSGRKERFTEVRKQYYLRHRDRLKEKAKVYYKNTDPVIRAAMARNSHLMRKFGITHQDYEVMFASQNGVCKICGGVNEGRWAGRLIIDHDHATGEIRGLLCSSCNLKLGWMEKHFEQIKKYMEKSTCH